MKEQIDARGLACPAPVVKTRDAIKKGARDIEVLVDNPTARDNVSRFAASRGCHVGIEEDEGVFRIISNRLELKEGQAPISNVTEERRSVVVLSDDSMGRGERELGAILMKAFLNTLSESDPLPWRPVLLDRGVLLAKGGADTVVALKRLCDAGVEILVCGTFLDFFGIKEKVAAGMVSNMYDILTTMLTATNTVSI